MANDILTDTLRQLLRDPASTQSVVLSEESVESLVRKLTLTSASTSGTAVSDAGSELLSGSDGDSALTEAQDRLARQLASLTEVAQQQTQTTEANTAAVIENSIARASGDSGSTLASVGKTLASFLGGGFGLFKLVGSLFGGGEPDTTTTLSEFTLPAAVNYDAALTGAGTYVSPVRYGQDGLPRAVSTAPASQTNITVQVEALDSRSFIDRSEDIALAVKRALLDSHSLSDVMAEL